jgi:hypothetical protein
MGITREYNVDNLVETDELPSAGTPTAASDLMTKGYADSHYAPMAPAISGTRVAPLNIVAGTGIPFSSSHYSNIAFVQGNGVAVVISANPQIAPGSAVGQRLMTIGCDDTKTVKLVNGSGIKLRDGSAELYLFADSKVEWIWDGANWGQI